MNAADLPTITLDTILDRLTHPDDVATIQLTDTGWHLTIKRGRTAEHGERTAPDA